MPRLKNGPLLFAALFYLVKPPLGLRSWVSDVGPITAAATGPDGRGCRQRMISAAVICASAARGQAPPPALDAALMPPAPPQAARPAATIR